MRILLTNASGFVGKNLYNKIAPDRDIQLTAIHGRAPSYDFIHDGDRINNTYGDLTNKDFINYLGNSQYDVIFHLAGNPSVRANDDNLLQSNFQTTYNLLKIARGSRFIFTSSSTVYGNGNKHLPFDEGDRCLPTSFYGVSKLMCENLINMYTRQCYINGVNLRLCANVGNYATHGFLPDLIRKYKSPSSELELFGDKPGSIKPYVHVSDTIRALLYFMNNNRTLSWNVCPNDVLSVEQISNLVGEKLGINKPKKWLGEQSVWVGDNKEFAMSNNKLVKSGFQFKYKNSKEAILQATEELQ
jgi:UDP-glucose 4-epimerase